MQRTKKAGSLTNHLIAQSANPHGLWGRILLFIWGKSFAQQDKWALGLVNFRCVRHALIVGFGSGGSIKRLHKRMPQGKVDAVDLSPQAVRHAQQKCARLVAAEKADIRQGDVAALPYADNAFDFLYAGQTHIHWEALEKGLAECLRVLAPGGQMLIACEQVKIAHFLPQCILPDTFSRMLLTLGFEPVQISQSGTHTAFIAQKPPEDLLAYDATCM